MKRLLALLVAAASVVAVTVPTASAQLHWPKYSGTTERNIPYVKDAGGMNSATDSAAGLWNASPFVNYQSNTGTTGCSLISNKLKVCLVGQAGYAGLTELWADAQDHIYWARVTYNNYEVSLHTGSAWRVSLACHELGHALGMYYVDTGERTSTGSCTTYGIQGDPPPAWQQAPDSADFSLLSSKYSHLDGFGFAAQAGFTKKTIKTMSIGPEFAPTYFDKVTIER